MSTSIPDESALSKVLARIPSDYPPLISMGAGWLTIIVELDAQLTDLDPAYTLLEAKEKFGLLRYHAQTTLLGTALDAFQSAIASAERRCETTCEECGSNGHRCVDEYRWYRVLCPRCAAVAGYSPITDDDEWIYKR